MYDYFYKMGNLDEGFGVKILLLSSIFISLFKRRERKGNGILPVRRIKHLYTKSQSSFESLLRPTTERSTGHVLKGFVIKNTGA